MKSYEEVAARVLRRRDEYEEKQQKRHAALRRAGTVISAFAIVIALVGTAGTWYVLAEYLGAGDWFKSFFHNEADPTLTTQQQEYIDENAVGIGQSVTCSGISITARSAITDGTTAYILLDIAAPESVDLDVLNGHGLGFKHTLKPYNPNRRATFGGGVSFFPMDDGDGMHNTISMLLRIYVTPVQGSEFTFADGLTRYLRLEDFGAYLEEYPYSRYTIAEGEWSFSFEFTELDDNEVDQIEILSTPIIVTGTRLSGAEFQMIVTSIQLRGLSATCHYTFADGVTAESSDFGPFQIVMKDGTIVTAQPRGAGIYGAAGTGIYTDGHCTYLFDAPVIFDKIDHLVLSDGQEIPVN